MVDRYVSPPVELPDPEVKFTRADLVFYGVDHSGSSFEADIYFGAKAGSGPDDPSYAGSFWIFGHGGCFGDIGHCDIPAERDPFDLRPPHQLEPAVRILTVTEPVEALLGRGVEAAKVTVTARTAGRTPADVLAFEKVRLMTYA